VGCSILAEPLMHFVVPFIVFIMLGMKFKKSFFLSLLALTPDFDVLLLNVHRSISHSLVLLFLLAVPLLGLTWKNRGRRNIVFMALLAVASHIILDLTSYTPILYPIIKDSYCIVADLVVHFSSPPNFTFILKVLSEPTVFTPIKSLDAELFTGEGLIIALVLLAPVFVQNWKNILIDYSKKSIKNQRT
jgi:membrane-bound metal-dependent hydrolase YbcI (DUF457 family)